MKTERHFDTSINTVMKNTGRREAWFFEVGCKARKWHEMCMLTTAASWWRHTLNTAWSILTWVVTDNNDKSAPAVSHTVQATPENVGRRRRFRNRSDRSCCCTMKFLSFNMAPASALGLIADELWSRGGENAFGLHFYAAWSTSKRDAMWMPRKRLSVK